MTLFDLEVFKPRFTLEWLFLKIFENVPELVHFRLLISDTLA